MIDGVVKGLNYLISLLWVCRALIHMFGASRNGWDLELKDLRTELSDKNDENKIYSVDLAAIQVFLCVKGAWLISLSLMGKGSAVPKAKINYPP